jgi:ubiquinol-cytochrome c reductase cytochrome b subunit
LRIMPAWEWNFLGHTITFSALIPFAVPLTVVLGGAAFWPSFERWATGDKAYHNVNDRPRNAPIRTATGMAVIAFYAVLWLEGANDVIADNLSIPLYTITWIARVMVFVAPVIAFYLTRRICLALQRKDRGDLLHGFESGIIRQLPNGGFIEVHQPVNQDARAVLAARRAPALLPGSTDDHRSWAERTARANRDGVPAPKSGGPLGRARAIANRAFAETTVTEPNGHGNGHGNGNGNGNGRANGNGNGNGHQVGDGRAAVGSGRSGVVKDQAQGVPAAGTDDADSVPDRGRGPAPG